MEASDTGIEMIDSNLTDQFVFLVFVSKNSSKRKVVYSPCPSICSLPHLQSRQ